VHPAVEYHLLRTTEALNDFVPEWRRLFRRIPQAIPFQSAEWLFPWWRQFGNEELCAMVITRRDEAIGFIPLYVYLDKAKRERQLLPLGVGTTDYLDGIFAHECSTEEIVRGVEIVRREIEHDVFCVPQLHEHSRMLEALRHSGSLACVSQSNACSRMVAVRMAELPQKIKRNAMYYRNRAQRLGTLELVQAGARSCGQVFEDLRRLHCSRWQSRGEAGVLVDERVLRWHREAIPLLLNAGLLRLMALRLGGETIAVLYSLVDVERAGRTQYFYITAYSLEHADLRPGTLLIAYAVEHAANAGVEAIDMLRGDESYKQIWHMEKVPTFCVTQFAAKTADVRRESAA
jgi:CelD/BcsL family acetyltransferase involved in cellulose biosynthesis